MSPEEGSRPAIALPPLREARLIRRYKRFLADIDFGDGDVRVASCPNSGRMIGVSAPGTRIWVGESAATAKHDWLWWLAEADTGTLTGINTQLPNRLVGQAVTAGAIPELAGYPTIEAEKRYGRNSRIDLRLSGGVAPACYVEIKNVHMRRSPGPAPAAAEFPDAVTARGTKHMEELAAMARQGYRAVVFFLVQRSDCDAFTVAADIDPAYERALKAAVAAGVEALCYGCTVTLNAVTLAGPLPVRL